MCTVNEEIDVLEKIIHKYGWMTCVRPNYHSAVQKFSCLFYWKWLNGNFARHFKIKNIYIFECEWPNGNSNDLWMVGMAIWPFTLKLKRKRKLRDIECTMSGTWNTFLHVILNTFKVSKSGSLLWRRQEWRVNLNPSLFLHSHITGQF